MTAWPINPTELRGLRALGILAALLGVAFGCEIEEPQPKPQAVVQPYAERDSAGIRLVQSTLPLWEPGRGWQIHPEPVLELGTVDGEEPYVFTQLAQAGKLSDGRLFVVDRRTHQIRTFDREGRHVRSFGHPGDGPGQFGASPVVTVVPGDSVLTFDAGVPGTLSTPEFAWFLPDGSLVRSTPFATLDPADARDLRDLGGEQHLIPDGTLVAARRVSGRRPVGTLVGTGRASRSPWICVRDRTGLRVDACSRRPGCALPRRIPPQP